MGTFLNFSDLSPYAPSMTADQAEGYIAGIEARASIAAPCITADNFKYAAAVKDILREAILRRHSARDGAAVTNTQAGAGTFSIGQTVDTRVFGNGALSRADIRQLKELCRIASGVGSGRKAFTVGPK